LRHENISQGKAKAKMYIGLLVYWYIGVFGCGCEIGCWLREEAEAKEE
jgi:hypothetical protein